MSRLPLARALVLVTLSTAALLSGCGGPQTPPFRMGSLPYPSPFFAVADPADLGEHRFGGWSFQEAGRGIMYSERGGFIDLAHVRIIADWTWFYYQRVHAAIEQGVDELTLPMNKGSEYDVSFHYCQQWDAIEPDEREELVHELALAVSKELAWIMGAWHEIATWYGYSRFIIGSEEASAFTHDDTFSHVVGLRAVGRAINNRELDYNEAMTLALEEELHFWRALPPEQTREAVERVRGRWFNGSGAIRLYLDVSLNGEPQRPWLTPDEPGEPGRLGEPFEVPRVGKVNGRDFSNFYSVRIRPRILEAPKIRRAAGIDSGPIDPFEHFPRIMEDIRTALLERHGPDADQP